MIRISAVLLLSFIVFLLAPAGADAQDRCARGADKGPVTVYFDVGQTQVNEEGKEKLQRFADRAKNFSNVCVQGFADKQGDPSVNERISRERAANVTALLVSYGVEKARIVTIAGGEAFGSDSLFGLAQNAEEDRRVTVSYGN
jgi:OOP family OmpA-OmpF porin